LLANCTFEIRIVDTLPIDVKEIEMFLFDAPGGANTIVAELCRFVRSVPTLNIQKGKKEKESQYQYIFLGETTAGIEVMRPQ
jgi:hypothetical protein